MANAQGAMERIRLASSDQRTLLERARVAFIASLALAFTFVVFGILDVFISNRNSIPFPLREIWWIVLLSGLVAWLALATMLLILRGKLFDIAVSLVLGVLIAGYCQGNFLNLDLGQLNGAVAWEQYTGHALKNTLVWCVLIALPVVVRWLWPRVWRALAVFVPLLLTGMQLVALITALVTTQALSAVLPDHYLSMQGSYSLSKRQNIVVFLLDYLDANIVRNIFDASPRFFDPLDGFTNYTDNLSMSSHTFPSMAAMLTGEMFFLDKPPETYLRPAWRNAPFIPALRAHGLDTRLYIQDRYDYWDAGDLLGLADNVRPLSEPPRVERGNALRHLVAISAYRYAPHIAKATFWRSSDIFARMVHIPGADDGYTDDNYAFYRGLMDQRLTADGDRDLFLFYHLQGSHWPARINEKVEPVPTDQTSIDQQSRGCFEIIYEYIRQMKALGIYADATIIITGDHGFTLGSSATSDPKLTGLFVKPKGSHDVPLAFSSAQVSAVQFRATVLREAGIAAGDYGPTYADTPEGQDVQRVYYRVSPLGSGRGSLEQYRVEGEARNIDNWHLEREIEGLYQ